MVKKIKSRRIRKNNKDGTKKNKILLIIIPIIVIITLISAYLIYKNYKQEQELRRRESLVANITKNYHQFVKTTNKANIYEFKDNEYQIIGSINADVNLKLNESNITYQTKYFQISDLNYYIEYENVIPSSEQIYDDRYKSYIVFNKNIITNDKVSFYDESNNLFMTINKSFEFPIIIKDKDRYGVEFYNQLLYIKEEDVKETKTVTNTKTKVRSNIRTLTYHTVYDKKTQSCNNIYVCHPIEQFEKHMKYLHDNNYLTLTMEELEMFLDGKIRIPKKTIVITLDDGRRLANSVPIVEKYKINATFFVITSKYSIEKYKDSKYAKFESHTDNLHNNYVCNSGYYGGQLLCEDYQKIIADLKLSQEKLGGSSYFAYPFFDSNERAIKALKETGFKMAFIGEYTSQGYSTPSTNRYQLRRKTVFGDDPLSTLISYLAESE